MNKELLKTTRETTPKKPIACKECWEIICYGSGIRSAFFKKEHIEYRLDDVDIALLSYFKAGTKYDRLDENKWKVKYTNKDIFNGPLAFILPYLYDHNEFNVFDSGWDKITSIEVFWYDSEGNKFEEKLPKIDDIFDNVDELISYIKEQMKIIRPDRPEDEGICLQPWEIDEAREVLEQAGWDEQELRYLRWIGCGRGFGACIEIHQKFADYMIKKFDNSKQDQYVLSRILDALKIANQKCTSLGWNGPQGYCGVYIYRSSEEIIKENGLSEDDSSIVRMPDGRIYTLHEGD
jgi:hypothetical protein